PRPGNGQVEENGWMDGLQLFYRHRHLSGEDSSSQSDEDPKNPVGAIATSDSDCKWEPERKSSRKFSPQSTTDDDDDWDYQHDRKGRAKKRSSHSSPSDAVRWRTHHEMDIEPWPLPFMPTRLPGPQHSTSHAESPLDFFRLFFTDSVIKTVLKNTNAYGTQNIFPRDGWKAFSFEDMFSFLSIVIFMGLLKLPQVVDYWKTTRPYNLPFPPSVMSKTKFLNICRSLHMCSLQEDTVNQAAKGTSAYDHLGKIQPLYSQIVEACRTHFHPDQNLSINERKVLPNEGLSAKHNLRHKYTMGYKLFALADSATGYAWNFFISDGSRTTLQNGSGKSLGYDTVMSLVDLERLGSGYHLYVNHFYTSPRLFRDLLAQNIGACGPFPHNKMDFLNDFTPSSPRGSIRWIRDDELLFVKWQEPREVALCSTIHKAYEGEMIQRRMKRGHTFVNVYLPIPPALMAYNQHMGVDNTSDGLNCYYNVLLKTKKWYRTFFYHFVDVAVVNAHILYNHSHKDKRMTQREFRDALVQELADNGSGATSKRAPEHPESATRTHKAMFLSKGQVIRRSCTFCHRSTPVLWETCDVPLCFLPQRNCYTLWHRLFNIIGQCETDANDV
uniref:PiggyBac transposable element-derived protein domain-containing protein n=1 Tax=Neogobius melanostomus TaxID=47308 RepID=A0A8C6WQU9_9GOBI